MKVKYPALGALIALASQSIAAPQALPPTAKWVVDFADAQCIASRNYGSQEDPLFLVIKEPPLGDVLQIAFVTKFDAATATQMDGEITFDEQPPIRASLLKFGIKKDDRTVLRVNFPRALVASLRAASSIRVHARDDDQPPVALGSRITQGGVLSTDYRLQLAQIPALLDILDKCSADLRKVWNVEDGDAAPTLVRQGPSGDLRTAFTPEDYPDVAVKNRQMGAIRVAVLVDEKGRVADCTIIQTSGVASLDAQSCAVITERAQLKPAIGLDGKPAKGALLETIHWELED